MRQRQRQEQEQEHSQQQQHRFEQQQELLVVSPETPSASQVPQSNRIRLLYYRNVVLRDCVDAILSAPSFLRQVGDLALMPLPGPSMGLACTKASEGLAGRGIF